MREFESRLIETTEVMSGEAALVGLQLVGEQAADNMASADHGMRAGSDRPPFALRDEGVERLRS